MLYFGAWISKLSVHLTLLTINMVESANANNSRHPRCALSRAEDEGRTGETFGQGIGSSKCGSRTSLTQVEEGAPHHSAARPIEAAKEA